MTAEIVVMNKEAIALAADSAVTLSEERGDKIFMSANKIFSLSKFHPVAIMVFGNASFMGVPWEIIIKVYRKQLGKKNFSSLKKYASDFIVFLDKKNQFVSESKQNDNFKENVYGYFSSIREQIYNEIKKIIERETKINDKQIEEITSKIIEGHYAIWNEAEIIPSLSADFVKELENKYKKTIDSAQKHFFGKLPINESLSNKLTEIAGNLSAKIPKILTNMNESGIVIAGFGGKDIFPSLVAFSIEALINNRLKYEQTDFAKISFNEEALVIAYAQKDMAYTFMAGVNPTYQSAIENDMAKIFDQIPEIIIDNIDKLNITEKNAQKHQLKELFRTEFGTYKKQLEKYRQDNFIDPIIDVVKMLPKDELASMAESLVNLTSLKRRVSMEAETVAGPIDVAVLSKGDGFIWIKRKNYFDIEKNPQFLEKYFKE